MYWWNTHVGVFPWQDALRLPLGGDRPVDLTNRQVSSWQPENLELLASPLWLVRTIHILQWAAPCWCRAGPGRGCSPCCPRTCGRGPHPWGGCGSRWSWARRRSGERCRWTSTLLIQREKKKATGSSIILFFFHFLSLFFFHLCLGEKIHNQNWETQTAAACFWLSGALWVTKALSVYLHHRWFPLHLFKKKKKNLNHTC